NGAFQVWAGVEDEVDARALSRRLGSKAPLIFREFSAEERNNQVHPVDLLVEQAEVRVEGLDATRLLQIRSVQTPVAPTLGARVSLGSFALPRPPDGVVRAIPHLINYARDEGDIH